MATITSEQSAFSHANSQQDYPRLRTEIAEDDYVVLANANARGFRKAWKRGYFDVIPSQRLVITNTLEEAEQAVEAIVDAGVGTIFACGGDGTIAGLLNQLRAAVPHPAAQPQVGVIRMGTGNALARYTNAGDAATDLQRIGAGPVLERVRMNMIETEGSLCPFTGCGVDAGVLNDYLKLKQTVSGTPLERLMTGVQGYLMSGVLKTAPQALSPARKRKVFVINDGPVAYSVNEHGDIIDTHSRGAVLYSGDALSVMAGSIPFYGYGIRMFPSATRLPDFFQVRVANMNPVSVVARLPQMWRGELARKHGIHDFLTQRVRLEFDGEVPFHIAGDAEGYRREVTLSLSQRRFDFVRPLEPSGELVAHPRFRNLN